MSSHYHLGPSYAAPTGLPEGWIAKQLAHLVRVVQGGRLKLTKEKNYAASGVSAYSAAGPDGFVECAEFYNQAGVILSAIGANCGRCFYAEGDWTTLANVQALFPTDELNARFLYYRTNIGNYWERSGSAQPFIKPSSIKKAWIAYPIELSSQQKISAILSTVDNAIEQTEALITKTQQLKAGLMNDLFTRGVLPNGQLRPPREEAPKLYKESPLGWIPREWDSSHLNQVAAVRTGIAKNEGRVFSRPISVQYLRVANVQDGFLDLSEMKTIQIEATDLERYQVLAGDVLMNEGGDLDKLGRGTVWHGSSEPCVHQNHVFVVRCNHCILPDFLNAWTATTTARRYFMVAGKQTTNLASINKTQLGHLPIPVPPPQEQSLIVLCLESVNVRFRAELKTNEKFHLIKAGLMDDLLTGRVRVPIAEKQKGAAHV